MASIAGGSTRGHQRPVVLAAQCTVDMGGNAGTKEFADAVVQALA